MKNKTIMWILGALGLTGILLFFKKPIPTGVPVTAGVPAVPTSAYPVVTGCEGKMVALAEQQLGLSRDQLTIRSLRPDDLGLGSVWSMNLATANAWNTTVNTTVADNRFICLKSVSYSGTAAEAVRVNVGASRVAEFNIQQIPGITTTHTATIRDIIAEQNTPIRIQVYASAISATDTLILSGTVVEKRGILLA